MNVGIIGLGSMGKRRIRLLKKINSKNLLVGIDNREDRRLEVKKNFNIEVCLDLEKAIKQYCLDSIIISTSPLSHAKLINLALNNNCHVFSEINLVKDGYEENIRLANEKRLALFLSSTPMYRNEIQYIRKVVNECTSPINYIYHVGQYLPTWHIWEGYKDFFVADKRTNGCREVFAIELPWIIDTFGQLEIVNISKGNMTNLDIDYPDYYIVNVKHQNGTNGCLHFNVASQKAVRNLEIYGQSLYLEWKGTPDTLFLYNSQLQCSENIKLYNNIDSVNNINDTIVENAYKNELEEFFEVITKGKMPRHSFERDIDIIDLIDEIEAGK